MSHWLALVFRSPGRLDIMRSIFSCEALGASLLLESVPHRSRNGVTSSWLYLNMDLLQCQQGFTPFLLFLPFAQIYHHISMHNAREVIPPALLRFSVCNVRV